VLVSAAILEAANLAVRYDDTVALGSSSFAVSAGEMVAVVGPNGAGKSSLFKALAGFIDHEGDVVVHGAHCHHLERQAIAYIPQQSDLDIRFPITVGDVVLAGRRRFHGGRMRRTPADAAHVAACLAQVDLVGTESRSLATLSGGQVQRVMLARALAQEADVLLLDEALSGVDSRHTEDLVSLFTDLCAEGTSILVSTHDLSLVRQRFTRCLTVNGRVLGDGAPAVELEGSRLDRLFSATRSDDAP
jgi:ABC-type Mn2+/Zn2+ transport system ATPase subunit